MAAPESMSLSVRYLGGPTAVLEIGGLRFLTDPTFDPEGEYPIGSRALTKTIGAVLSPDAVGPIDAVLLSHDQHPDNLDLLGREFVASAPLVLSTASAEERLGPPVRALPTWSSMQLDLPGGGALCVTAVPALHGPEGSEPVVGEVTGFVLGGEGLPTVYVSGDNASLENVAAIVERFERVDVALLFAGAARTALLDGAFLTLTSEAAAAAARRAVCRPTPFRGVGPLHPRQELTPRSVRRRWPVRTAAVAESRRPLGADRGLIWVASRSGEVRGSGSPRQHSTTLRNGIAGRAVRRAWCRASGRH